MWVVVGMRGSCRRRFICLIVARGYMYTVVDLTEHDQEGQLSTEVDLAAFLLSVVDLAG